MPSTCVRTWVTGLVALVYLPRLIVMSSIGNVQNIFSPPDIISDFAMINTQCAHSFRLSKRNLLTTSQTLVVGYVTDATHQFIDDTHHAGKRAIFLSLGNKSFPHIEDVQQGKNQQVQRATRDPEKLQELLISLGQLPTEIHFFAEIVTSLDVAEAHDVTSVLEHYVSLLQALALEARLMNIPVYTHLVGTTGTKKHMGDKKGDDCRTDLDYRDLKSNLRKQIELYSTVFKHIYNMPIHLLQC